jgi:hypothetical protein
MNREPDFFDRYKSYIIGGGALLVAQTAMIAGLLFNAGADAEQSASCATVMSGSVVSVDGYSMRRTRNGPMWRANCTTTWANR